MIKENNSLVTYGKYWGTNLLFWKLANKGRGFIYLVVTKQGTVILYISILGNKWSNDRILKSHFVNSNELMVLGNNHLGW